MNPDRLVHYMFGIPNVDEEHKKMFHLLTLGKIYSETEQRDNLNFVLERIEKDLASHFQSEEDMMREVKYPYFATHKMEHERLLMKINQVVNWHLTNKFATFTDSLEDELLQHIDYIDRQYVPYLLNRE
jgi:hemerythrin-like metal-binding protein